ncbi:MAG TPA: hypothetical protein VK082_03780 [Paenalcaligenes sp.]|nr:hypothetical protein [Paenalcaligenes sp.]
MHIHQRGYALVLGLIGSGLLLLLWVHLQSVGRHLSQAHELRTALDTAAHSGAVVQSRTLNALSLLNRAYIGHQIASAHLLTLASWAHWAKTQARQSSLANPPVWLIDGFFGTTYGQAYQATQIVPNLSDLLSRLSSSFDAQQQFSGEHYGAFINALEAQTRDLRNAVIVEILESNIGQKQAHIKFIKDEWENVFMHFSAVQGISWVGELQNHFHFLQQRSQTLKSPTPVSERCPHLRHQLRRIGRTEIDEDGHWSVDDSLSFHALRSNRWIGCYYREYAMGWAWQPEQGAAFSNPYSEDARDSFADLHFWRWVDQQSGWGYLSESINPLANSYAVRDRGSWHAEPFRHLPYGKSTQYGFVLKAQVAQMGKTFTAKTGAHSQFKIPSSLRKRYRTATDEQAWFPFWLVSLTEF